MKFVIFHIFLLGLTGTLHLLLKIYRGDLKKEDTGFLLLEYVFIIAIVPFIPVFTGFFFVLLMKKMEKYVNLKTKRSQISTLIKIKRALFKILGFSGIIFLIIAYGVVIIGRIWGKDWYYSISTFVGILAGILILVKCKNNELSLFHTKKPLKKKSIILTIIVLISSMGLTIGINITNNNPKNLDTPVKVKTMSYNILYKGFNNTIKDWEYRKPYVVDVIELEDPDIFGTQEGYFEQLTYLEHNLSNRNYSWYGVGRDPGLHAGEHTAIFYDQDKYIKLNNGTFWLSETPQKPSTYATEPIWRIASWCKFKEKDSNEEFYFYNTHFGFYPEFHIRASMLLNNHIAQNTGDLPVILTGDFNMPNFFPFYAFLEGWGKKPLKEAHRVHHNIALPFDGTTATGCSVDPAISMHIDYVFVSQSVQVTSSEVVRYSYDETHSPSDHHPIVAEFEF